MKGKRILVYGKHHEDNIIEYAFRVSRNSKLSKISQDKIEIGDFLIVNTKKGDRILKVTKIEWLDEKEVLKDKYNYVKRKIKNIEKYPKYKY